MAKRLLADEYDAAQERGEVSTGRPKTLPDGNTSATAKEIGFTSKEVHEARQIRDAEVFGPHGGAAKRVPDQNPIATIAETGLTKKVHEARQTRVQFWPFYS